MIDYLKKNYTKIHFFGLGFVQVKLDDHHRYHFYHPKLQAFVDSPHDHRYWFKSEVIRGSLTNIIWSTDTSSEPNATIRRTNCTPEGETTARTLTRVSAHVVTSFTTHANSSYYLSPNEIHQVRVNGTEPCITSLERGPKVKDLSTVVHLDGDEEACPFSMNLPESQLWDLVRECFL